MVQSPSWAANRFAASQEIPHISQNPKVHYRTHNRPPPVSILGQPNPVHTPTPHPLEIHPNIIHPSTPRSPQWSPSLQFPHQDPIHPPLLTHMRHMSSPSHSSPFYHPHNIGWGTQINSPKVFKIDSAFYFGSAREKCKKPPLASNVSTGNITPCHEQHVACKKRVEQVWFNLLLAILSCFPLPHFGSLFITTYVTSHIRNLKGQTQHHYTHFVVTIFNAHVNLPSKQPFLTNFCFLDFQNQLSNELQQEPM